MIRLENKKDCCGCSACFAVCPRGCISMVEDDEGFRYLEIDESLCVNCGMCDKVCPVINKFERPSVFAGGGVNPSVYKAVNADLSARMGSSSGGIFPALAKKTLADGGVVFGSKWIAQDAIGHSRADDVSQVAEFFGSKYLPSDMGGCFREIRKLISDGKFVMFSGTPCQIAGLKHFLGRAGGELLCVEVFCHGVPSRRAFAEYLKSFAAKRNAADFKVISYRFRAKDCGGGWRKYSSEIIWRDGECSPKTESFPVRTDAFSKAFLGEVCLRPSCHDCPAKGWKSGADLSIGDFWRVGAFFEEKDDNTGISLVCANTDKGLEFLKSCAEICMEDVPYAAVVGNVGIDKSVEPHINRSKFMSELGLIDFEELVAKYVRESFKKKAAEGALKFAVSVVSLLGLRGVIKKLRRIK